MNADWQVVVLDIVLILELWLIGIFFSGNLGRVTFWILTAAFLSMGFGFLVITLGDIAIALGDPPKDVWFMSREWRALPWRYTFAIGFAAMAGVMRFGNVNGQSKDKR